MIFIFLIITINNFIFITESNNKMGNCSSKAPAAYAAPADSPWIINKRGREVCKGCTQSRGRSIPTDADVATGVCQKCSVCGLQMNVLEPKLKEINERMAAGWLTPNAK